MGAPKKSKDKIKGRMAHVRFDGPSFEKFHGNAKARKLRPSAYIRDRVEKDDLGDVK